MNIYLTLLIALMVLSLALSITLLLFIYLKFLHKTRYPKWTFLDHVSVS